MELRGTQTMVYCRIQYLISTVNYTALVRLKNIDSFMYYSVLCTVVTVAIMIYLFEENGRRLLGDNKSCKTVLSTVRTVP